MASSSPLASATVAGAIKVGSGLAVASDGTLSTTGGSGTPPPPIPVPALNNAVAYTYDPMTSNNVGNPAIGCIRFGKAAVNPGQVITNISIHVTATGTGVSGLYLVLYDTSGNFLARTPDITASLAIGDLKAALTSPYTIPGGMSQLLVGILTNAGTTGITVTASETGQTNINLVSGTDCLRAFTTSGGLTGTPPATISVTSGITSTNGVILAVLS